MNNKERGHQSRLVFTNRKLFAVPCVPCQRRTYIWKRGNQIICTIDSEYTRQRRFSSGLYLGHADIIVERRFWLIYFHIFRSKGSTFGAKLSFAKGSFTRRRQVSCPRQLPRPKRMRIPLPCERTFTCRHRQCITGHCPLDLTQDTRRKADDTGSYFSYVNHRTSKS